MYEYTKIINGLIRLTCYISYREVLLTRPPMVLVESGLNSEQVSLMRPFYIEKCILVQKQVVHSDGGLNFKWSL